METTITKTSRTKRTIPATPTQDAIAWRAYELWLTRGSTGGCEVEDWLTAERELQSAKPGRKKAAA